MGLDLRIVMCKNHKQIEDDGFWNTCCTGWIKNEFDEIDYTQPSELYYARKFWDLYTPTARRLHLDNGEFSEPLTREDLEFMINIATHNPDYWDSFNTVPTLCEILYHYNDIKDAGMVLLFEGDY